MILIYTGKTEIVLKREQNEDCGEIMQKEIVDLLEFINTSPTAWHAVSNAKEKLKKKGFAELKEENTWSLEKGKKYFVSRNGSSLCTFTLPKEKIDQVKTLGTHTDSPALKLKPNAEFRKLNMIMMGVEVYGGPLLTSWLNRDLGIAGRIFFLDKNDKIQESLVCLDEHPLVIPQLAIHLDRQVNESGLTLNKQEHLSALAALDPYEKETAYLEKILKEKVKFTKLLSHDLFLYPLEPAKLVGYNQQMVSGYRIDSLYSVHAALQAILSNEPSKKTLKMGCFWDNEEVGSSTSQGAGSPFFLHVLERISLALKMPREEYLALLNRSLCISADLGQAINPNYMDKHDPRHQPVLGGGIILKWNAQQRYITDSESGAFIAHLCKKGKIPLQEYVNRSDIPSGSTIGPIHAHLTGMKTVDIGAPQLSMHSARELAACQDYLEMKKLLTLALE